MWRVKLPFAQTEYVGGYYDERSEKSGEIKGIVISYVICNANEGICVFGTVQDSGISNVINMRKDTPLIHIEEGAELINVKTENLVQM